MRHDISFFSYLLLVGAGILAIAGFFILVLLLGQKKNEPTIITKEPVEKPSEEIQTIYFPDQNQFVEESFGFSFYYPKDWFVSDNGSYTKDEFINTDSTQVLKGYVISTFNNPDYQIGKQPALAVKVFENSEGLDPESWLIQYSRNRGELTSKTINNLVFWQASGENQVYTTLNGGEIIAFTAVCGENSKCLGDKQTNQEIFNMILENLTFK